MRIPNPFEADKSAKESQQWEMIKSPLLETDKGDQQISDIVADRDEQ